MKARTCIVDLQHHCTTKVPQPASCKQDEPMTIVPYSPAHSKRSVSSKSQVYINHIMQAKKKKKKKKTLRLQQQQCLTSLMIGTSEYRWFRIAKAPVRDPSNKISCNCNSFSPRPMACASKHVVTKSSAASCTHNNIQELLLSVHMCKFRIACASGEKRKGEVLLTSKGFPNPSMRAWKNACWSLYATL
jgi:hypothetical protein